MVITDLGAGRGLGRPTPPRSAPAATAASRRAGTQVEAAQLVAGADQVARHGQAHVAEPDEADDFAMPMSSTRSQRASPSARSPSGERREVGRRPRPGVTSASSAGRQRGRLSLSMISARTPSRKSCPARKRWTSRYSRRMAASKSSVAPVLQLAEGDREAGRRLGPELLELGRSPGRTDRRASASSTPSRPRLTKHAIDPRAQTGQARPRPGSARKPASTRSTAAQGIAREVRRRRARPRAPRAGPPARGGCRSRRTGSRRRRGARR